MPETQTPEERQKRTVWLIAGGGASLLIPLLGALCLNKCGDPGVKSSGNSGSLFERREYGARKITPSQTVTLPAPSQSSLPTAGAAQKSVGSSLDFVKSGAELREKISAEAQEAATQSPPAAPASKPEATPASKSSGKPGKKPFTMPKLQSSGNFSNFGSGAPRAGAKKADGQNLQELLKNLPPGAMPGAAGAP